MRRAAAALAAGLALVTLSASARAAPSARVLYMLQCQGCHLADGAGAPDAVPDLRDRMARYLTVEGGREYLVRVPGSAMSQLDDAELARVLNWMLLTFGPEAVARAEPPFDSAEVAGYGRSPLTDVDGMRAALLRELGAPDGHPAPVTDLAPERQKDSR